MESQQHATNTQKWLIGILTTLLVIIIGSYFYLDHYYSQSATANRFVSAIEKNNPKTVASLIHTDDPDFKITPRSVQPLMTYYQHHPNQRAKLKRRMSATGVVNRLLDFVDVGHHFFLFENYTLQVAPIFPTISSNRDHVQVKINGHVVAKSLTQNTTRTFGPYIPGRYNIQLTTKTHGHRQTLTQRFDWIDPTVQQLQVHDTFK